MDAYDEEIERTVVYESHVRELAKRPARARMTTPPAALQRPPKVVPGTTRRPSDPVLGRGSAPVLDEDDFITTTHEVPPLESAPPTKTTLPPPSTPPKKTPLPRSSVATGPQKPPTLPPKPATPFRTSTPAPKPASATGPQKTTTLPPKPPLVAKPPLPPLPPATLQQPEQEDPTAALERAPVAPAALERAAEPMEPDAAEADELLADEEDAPGEGEEVASPLAVNPRSAAARATTKKLPRKRSAAQHVARLRGPLLFCGRLALRVCGWLLLAFVRFVQAACRVGRVPMPSAFASVAFVLGVALTLYLTR